ncbi:MAG: squalene/phytoene synthase family protein, partial [Rhodospirillaceae bacterium]
IGKPPFVPTALPSTASPVVSPPKTSRDESFPVAWLLPGNVRAPVLAYYAFARKADDVADSALLSSDDKLARLNALDDALIRGEGDPAAVTLHAILTQRGLPFALATDLLEAFRRDALNPRCATWSDLMEYCRLSAMPVGRFLLAACEEPPTPDAMRASDALCAALQILNHVQDCGRDWRGLKRVYIPTAWLAEAGLTAEVLGEGRCPPALRLVLDRVLAHTDALLREAVPLPGLIKHRRLSMQAVATVSLAHALRRRLAVGDPLAARIKPSRADWLIALFQALSAGVRR